MVKYPNAKVILTVRDPEKWCQSAIDTIMCMQPGTPYCPWGVGFMHTLGSSPVDGKVIDKLVKENSLHGDVSREHMIRRFKEHIEEVKRKVPQDKLLIFEASEGWEPICKFLGKPIPKVPYPRKNDTAEFQRIVTILNTAGIVIASLLFGVLPIGVGLAMNHYGVFKAFMK